MSEIKLELRYPESRPEDITDAFMRGYTSAVEASMKLIKEREDMNTKLRELVGDIWVFGFSNSAGANSVKEWYRIRDDLEQRVYAALEMEVHK